jgi:hypothetical protein
VQDALPIVVVAVVLVAGLVGVALLFTSRGAYDRIGRSSLSFDTEASGADADTTRDEEIAQMLAASNARRAARGRPPLTLDELRAAPDPELVAEVRAFVEARNRRLVARGRAPLDVETEVERRLSGRDG